MYSIRSNPLGSRQCVSIRLSIVVGSRAEVSAACQVERQAIPGVVSRHHIAALPLSQTANKAY